MGRLLIILFFSVNILPAFSQEAGKRNSTYSRQADLFIVDTAGIRGVLDELKIFLADSVDNVSSDLFLNDYTARKYTGMIFRGTDNAVDKKYLDAVSDFYVLSSSDARNFLLKYQDYADEFVLKDYSLRFGVNENMKVITLMINSSLSGVQKEALKLNLVSFDGRYRILNIEN